MAKKLSATIFVILRLQFINNFVDWNLATMLTKDSDYALRPRLEYKKIRSRTQNQEKKCTYKKNQRALNHLNFG